MKKSIILGLCLAITAVFVLASSSAAAPTWDNNPNGFEHGLEAEIEGQGYYFKGPGSVQGVIDVPLEELTMKEEQWYKDRGYIHTSSLIRGQ